MKYLFTTFHGLDENGAEIYVEQTPQDISKINPEKSAYYDVLQLEEAGKPPLKFCLVGNGSCYLVDLIDGSFSFGNSEEAGAKFWLDPPRAGGLKLIYYRHNEISVNCLNGERRDTTSFNFGWQVIGSDVKRIITVK